MRSLLTFTDSEALSEGQKIIFGHGEPPRQTQTGILNARGAADIISKMYGDDDKAIIDRHSALFFSADTMIGC
jgi:hypothetical protein